jgi:lipopolysaccharide/colanic/teichoic acid biosynthesis glycosyltransferase
MGEELIGHRRFDRARWLLTRRRVQLITTVVLGALLPWLLRGLVLRGEFLEPSSVNTLTANAVAIVAAFWMRLSIETYPGIRRAYLILLSASTAHGCMLVWFLMTRFPYDRIALVLGFGIHVAWLLLIFGAAEFAIRRRIAVVPFGRTKQLRRIEAVDWLVMSRARLQDIRGCQAIVADFAADLPEEWEGFLAEAALAGRIVYQVKQLGESLTGRVEIEHLSENSFGLLVPARGYFYLKSFIDFISAVLLSPVILPLMAVIAAAIRLDSEGPALYRQKRMGRAGRHIVVYKFRTMQDGSADHDRAAAMTRDSDERITRVGSVLRKFRLDELPQILNILRGEMSWIGPRPEAEALSLWYQAEIPFYRYRHVVKPGISGWAQVNQGHVADVEQVHRKLQYDFYYIKYFSPWLDLLILVRTVKTMLTGFGSR